MLTPLLEANNPAVVLREHRLLPGRYILSPLALLIVIEKARSTLNSMSVRLQHYEI